MVRQKSLFGLILVLLPTGPLTQAVEKKEQRSAHATPSVEMQPQKGHSKESAPCPSSLKGIPGCADRCSLRQWTQKIETLKERPIEFSTLPLKKDYQRSILSLHEFMSTIQTAATIMARASCNNRSWLGKESLYTAHPEIYTLDRPFSEPAADVKNFLFKPHVRRLIAQPGTELVFFGDLHGSVHSLKRDLEKLKDEGFIDNSFKLKKSNSYMVFLGDYIDRGIYGVEVMYTLARLVIANPERVILVRGNHEDYILAPDFRKKHTKQEEKDNAPSFIDELYRKFDFSVKDEVTLFRFYELLPLAFFVGCGTASHTDFVQCCHGGLEIGYNPSELLNAEKGILFERITTLWRKKYFDHKLTAPFRSMISNAFAPTLLDNDVRDMVPDAPFFKVGTTGHVAYNGFMWNDFYVDPLKTVGQRGKKFTGWVYGKALAHQLLLWGNSKKVTLHGVVRGHQHNNETGGPMLNLLCCSQGIVDVWHDTSVYTLVSAPDSKLEDTGEQCFTYDSFVVLKVASSFKDWQLRHYAQDIGREHKEWKVKQIVRKQPASKRSCPKEMVITSSKSPVVDKIDRGLVVQRA